MDETEMETEMEEEEEEEEEGINNITPSYDVVEVDFEYEFDAATFFDFTKPESEAQARLSELWFHSKAPNYPPSPFVTKLFQMDGFHSQNADAIPTSQYDDSASMVDDDIDINQHEQYSYQNKPDQEKRSHVSWNVKGGKSQDSHKQESLFGGQSMGLLFYNHLANDMKKTKTKSLAKPCMPRSSTLMRPTASQLAKQKQRQQVIDVRFKLGEGLSSSHSVTENQASKRQKLDGGLSHKIVDMKQPTILTHKIPKKDVAPQSMSLQSKLRITIPREPDLETAHRAERTRSVSNKEGERSTSTIGRFKARPLNKKIFEAPVGTIPKKSTPLIQDFQGFRFKTTERTRQPTSTATTITPGQTMKGLNKGNPASISEPAKKDGKRCDSVEAPKLVERQLAYSFKARPLDKKILTSRGDLGVFRNSKRDVTVPKEFEFQTAKRNHQNPPVDLFSKLSLAGEPQPKNFSQPQLPYRACISSKGSKENRWDSCQQDPNMKLQTRETQHTHQGKQMLNIASVGIGELGLGNGMGRAGQMWR